MLLAVAGDVMLGRRVSEAMTRKGAAYPWRAISPQLVSADLRLINLECAITASDERWLDADGQPKQFYFRAEPFAGAGLAEAGIDFASLANNHAGDFGEVGLLDTVAYLDAAGIKHAGAGANRSAAAQPALLEGPGGFRVAVLAFADFPPEWAAGPVSPGLNYLDPLAPGATGQIAEAIGRAWPLADALVVSFHWGHNWISRPSAEFRSFAHATIDAGATLFWGHSAHLVQGVELWHGKPILYDTGNFIDDYRRHGKERNDLSALFFVDLSDSTVTLLPIRIQDCQARPAKGRDLRRFLRRFGGLCKELGTAVTVIDGIATVEGGSSGAAGPL